MILRTQESDGLWNLFEVKNLGLRSMTKTRSHSLSFHFD